MRTWLIRAAVGYTNEHLLRSGEELLRAKPRRLFHHRQHGIAPLFMIESAMLAVPILSAEAGNKRLIQFKRRAET